MYRKNPVKLKCMLGLLVLLSALSQVYAETLAPPDDPRQSITYWRQHTISPQNDSLAAMAQGVFAVLLRAWDNTRLEPGLHVVKSSAGPWAASLADGNILLSRAAIETCLKFGKGRAEHLLAFVLAHELAHQRSDDLWHQRFFRLIGNQGADVRKLMQDELQGNNKIWQDIGQKENQADHDGLIMMASVGYDPYQVIDKKDFFTVWVENVWQASCASQQQNQRNSKACHQAKNRAIRAHAQLTAVATQATLYDMGVQAFIAGRYDMARRYFTAYGRDYTNRAVLTAIGQAYFAEALVYYRQLVDEFGWAKPVYYYPLLIDASASMDSRKDANRETLKRAALSAAAQKIKKKMQYHIQQSIEYYEKAIRLEPKYARSYLLLAFSYLLDDNPYMVRGIIQGKYISLFGKDYAAELVLAMTNGIEGNANKAEQAFEKLTNQPALLVNNQTIPGDILVYSAYYNSAAYAIYQGEPSRATTLWKKLAAYARDEAKSVLFQLAVSHINQRPVTKAMIDKAPAIEGVRLGDRNLGQVSKKSKLVNSLWIEGDKYKVYRLDNGSRFIVNANKKVINAWQDSGKAQLDRGLSIGDEADRAMKTLGTPDRQLHLVSGEYLAYDTYGLAVHIIKDRIAGWFLYQPK